MREARTCYDHLAGRLGVEIMSAMIDRGHVAGGDGAYDPAAARHDPRAGFGRDLDYAVTDAGWAFLDELGVEIPPRRRVVRYCVDWSEQRHHLSGALGRGLLDRLLDLDWIAARTPGARSASPTRAPRGCRRRSASTPPYVPE